MGTKLKKEGLGLGQLKIKTQLRSCYRFRDQSD
jgi:hypothetical protein